MPVLSPSTRWTWPKKSFAIMSNLKDMPSASGCPALSQPLRPLVNGTYPVGLLGLPQAAHMPAFPLLPSATAPLVPSIRTPSTLHHNDY